MSDYMLQNAWRLHQEGNLAEAQRLYNEVLRSNPRHFGALQMLGFLHFQRAEFEDAEKIMARALKLDPNSVDALYNRGCALQALGRHKDALACFDKAIGVRRDHAPSHLNRGNALSQLCRYEEALASYDNALKLQPNYPEALLDRANALIGLNRPEEALANYDSALALEPRHPLLWNNRANALAELGRYEEAVASYGRALALDTHYADAFENRGAVLEQLNRNAEALADYERALALEPENLGALNRRARLLVTLKRPQEALGAFERILAVDARDVAAVNGKGVALTSLKRYEEALAEFARAADLDPASASAPSNRANVFIALRRHADALEACDHALALDPADASAWHNRGSALSWLRRHEEALASLDRALALAPKNAASWNSRGAALVGLKRYEEALKNFDAALERDPDDLDTLSNRATALSKLKRYAEAVETAERALALDPDHAPSMRELVHAKLNACDWHGLAELRTKVSSGLAAGRRVVHPFDNLATSDSEDLNRMGAALYVAQECPAASRPLWQGENYAHEKIRLAYLSTDFRAHAVGFLIVGTLEHHDKVRFETTGLSIGSDDGSENRARIVAAFDRFIDLRNRTDTDAARLIRELEIDILVDLNAYTGDSRPGILAHRAAPVQVNYLGYPGTMAASYIDYIVADRIVIPEDARTYYDEKIVYLPHTYQANDRERRVSAKPVTRKDAGLPDEGFVFSALSSAYKLAPDMFDVWMRLLSSVEGSVLWLLEDNPIANANLKREAEACGIAADRVVFAPHAPPDEHLARQKLADLFLDTLPYNAHTTASDALFMGLPVITCPGHAFPGRVAASILHAAGLPELVTDSLADYEALALKLARDKGALAALKAKLARLHGASPLFDTPLFTRHLESAYVAMWERARRGEPPESFAVEALSGR